jgi:hypothetical protein
MAPRKQFLLRIDPELWGDVEKWAADELRSVNAQIEYLLRDAVRRRKGGQAGPATQAGPGGPAGSGRQAGPPAPSLKDHTA